MRRAGFPFNLNSAVDAPLKTEFDQYRAQGVPHPLLTAAGIDADWQMSYKRQMEFYQWLLRRQGLAVARRGWFVYCNGRRDLPAFGGRLEFTIKLLPYEGDDGWVEETLAAIGQTLSAAAPPPNTGACEYCAFAEKAARAGEE